MFSRHELQGDRGACVRVDLERVMLRPNRRSPGCNGTFSESKRFPHGAFHGSKAAPRSLAALAQCRLAAAPAHIQESARAGSDGSDTFDFVRLL
jgi:hypothetical protein